MNNASRLFLIALITLATLATDRATAQRISLFDGETLNGWVTDKGEPVTTGWQAVDGVLTLDVSQGRSGNILTEQEYDHFVLEFEWRIAEGGNSGLKYKVKKFDGRTLGCEYQIIDDRDSKPSKSSTGSLYHVYAPNQDILVRPRGEFNQSRIVVCGNRIEHWLNGALLLTANVGSADWYANKAEGKFSDVDGFGENRLGRIMLTDHNSGVWYRNIYLTPLQPKVELATSSGPVKHRAGLLRRIPRRRANTRR
jgi:hypothetical protein